MRELQEKLIKMAFGADPTPTGYTPITEFGIGKPCVIRTHSAGVFFGTPVHREGREMLLKDSRRIYSWTGAFTLSAVSQNGIKDGKLAQVEPEKLVTEVIEVIPCSEPVATQLRDWKTHEV